MQSEARQTHSGLNTITEADLSQGPAILRLSSKDDVVSDCHELGPFRAAHAKRIGLRIEPQPPTMRWALLELVFGIPIRISNHLLNDLCIQACPMLPSPSKPPDNSKDPHRGIDGQCIVHILASNGQVFGKHHK